MRLALLIGELNHLQVQVGDIGNAYLEAYTSEKVCFIAGPEFKDMQGHLLVIVKALYGLRTSGARFHERFMDTLQDLGFTPSLNDSDLWLRPQQDHYEYICVYVDDLMVIMKDPSSFFTTLEQQYHYKLKGVGDPSYHLGGNFFQDPDGTLAWGAKDYIQQALKNYKLKHNGQLPRQYVSPLEKGDNPELETTLEVNSEGIKDYQSKDWCSPVVCYLGKI